MLANTNFIVTGFTLPGLKLTIYHTPYQGSNSQSTTLHATSYHWCGSKLYYNQEL